ncbi:MAG: alcohol dehydrogenase catalytic domain-containing protein [Bryobacterales bacterium]|nr:alcohol dehydrogenase catalytic domain-containing protein [Bryobacterales bacterium]
MLAVELGNRRVKVIQAPKPRRRAGYSLLRLRLAGVCNTDVELLRGYYGFSGRPGHEFVADVAESDSPALKGKRVVGEINLACRKCEWCARGLRRHCPNRAVLGIVNHPGAFAEYLTLPDVNLFPVPGNIPDEHAVFVEPLAAACEILDQVAIPKDARVAVLGDGKLGLLIAQVLVVHGAQVLQFGKHEDKLRIARKSGATTEITGTRTPVAEFDFVVEATGSAKGLAAAVRMVKPRGTIVMKSTVHEPVRIDTAPVIVNEVTLVGSRCGRFEPALALLQSGRIHLDELISEEYPLAKAPAGFRAARKRGTLKVLLRG